MDMVEKLDFIDKHYLSAYDSLNVDSEIREQKPFAAMQDLTMEYPVAEREGEEDNAYLSYNVVVGTAMDSLTSIAVEVLDYALLSAPGAPLKQALLDVGIGKDIYGAYEDGIRQPYLLSVQCPSSSAGIVGRWLALQGQATLQTLSDTSSYYFTLSSLIV